MADLKSVSGAIDAYNSAVKVAKGAGSTEGNVNGISFSNLISSAAGDSIQTLRASEKISSSALVDNVNLQDLATAVSEAEMTLKTVVAVRDRIISAYQDIIKMPI